MNTQINVRIQNNLFKSAQEFAKTNGYKNVQELMKEALREKISCGSACVPEHNPHVH